MCNNPGRALKGTHTTIQSSLTVKILLLGTMKKHKLTFGGSEEAASAIEKDIPTPAYQYCEPSPWRNQISDDRLRHSLVCSIDDQPQH
jgi:hypothetical protein